MSAISSRTTSITRARWAMAALTLLLAANNANAQLGLAASEIFSFISNGSRYGSAVAIGDINGDGRGDLVVGIPSADFGGFSNPGMITLYVSNPEGGLVFNLISNCLDGNDFGSGYQFGASLVFGHFNDDAYEDLAVGMPGAAAGAAASAGAVCVIYGSPTLPYSRARFSQHGLFGSPENGDEFGAAISAGDLNADGVDDLVVGAPGEGVFFDGGVVANAGAFHVVYGTSAGLAATDNQIFHQAQTGVPWIPQENDRFGESVAVGNFFATGNMDVVVGAPGDQGGPGGLVIPFLSGSTAVSPFFPGSLTWDILGTSMVGDDFGAAVVAGDFDGDGRDDLAIGIPGDDDFGTEIEPGAVMVIYNGPSNNIGDEGEQIFLESVIDGSSAGVNDFDRFGEVLASGDFNDDGFDDLAIGAPFDNSLGVANAGEVTVLYGTPTGLNVAGVQILDMIFFGTLELADEFGFALAAGKLYNSQGADDLVVGVPGRTHETVGGDFWPDTGLAVLVQSMSLFNDDFESGDVDAWSGSTP